MKTRTLTENEKKLFLRLSESAMLYKNVENTGLASAFYGLEEYGFVCSQFKSRERARLRTYGEG